MFPLRSTPSPFRLSRAFPALAALALTGLAIGCASLQSTESTRPSASAPGELPDYGDEPTNVADAAATSKASFRGNPLCLVEAACPTCCMPDDDGIKRTNGTEECATAPPDASDADPPSPGDDRALACRLGRLGSAVGPSLVCVEASWSGTDGATCETGADCAPGFDCIAGDKEKTCRHYCCLGGCKTQTSQAGGATFCDVQRLADVNHKAPVCMPLKRCKLLTQDECAATETCAIVNESGDTGCVTIGDKQVGESCDEDHCAGGLTCLGQAGARRCQALCAINGGSMTCGPGQECETSAIFKNSDVGICQ